MVFPSLRIQAAFNSLVLGFIERFFFVSSVCDVTLDAVQCQTSQVQAYLCSCCRIICLSWMDLKEDVQADQQRKAVKAADSVSMLMSLRFAVRDANGQESKHWTNCASGMKTSPATRPPRHWGWCQPTTVGMDVTLSDVMMVCCKVI